MSGDLRLAGAAAPVSVQAERTVESPASGQRASPFVALVAAPVASDAAARSAALPNPRLHTDLALNRLVLEFFNAQGALTNSIPSQKQLEAYRLAAFAGRGLTR